MERLSNLSNNERDWIFTTYLLTSLSEKERKNSKLWPSQNNIKLGYQNSCFHWRRYYRVPAIPFWQSSDSVRIISFFSYSANISGGLCTPLHASDCARSCAVKESSFGGRSWKGHRHHKGDQARWKITSTVRWSAVWADRALLHGARSPEQTSTIRQ